MAQVTHPMPTVTAPGSLNATRMTFHPQTAATQFPWEEGHMQPHIVVIVVIFCGVCLLLLLAFFYAFCFHCSITSTPTDSHSSVRSGQDREDATFKCTSTEGLSIGNHI